MAFAHTYEYPVVADNSRVTHYEPVHFSFDFGTHNRHRFRIESQQTSDIFFPISVVLRSSGLSFTVVPHDSITDKSSTLKIDLIISPRFCQIALINFAGTPPTIVFAATSFVTTAPAATTALSPMVTPCSIVAFEPTQTFSRVRWVRGRWICAFRAKARG